jgi:glycine/D-amino acid oxidase-like deaminating enzyme
MRQSVGLFSKYLPKMSLADQFGIDREGAILSEGNLALDPLKLASGLLRKAAERGTRLYTPVEAIAIRDSKDEVVVSTRQGPAITAGHVVLATGYELVELVPSERHRIISTWAIATRPQRRKLWPQEAMVWEASDPYLYIRTTADGRVILWRGG